MSGRGRGGRSGRGGRGRTSGRFRSDQSGNKKTKLDYKFYPHGSGSDTQVASFYKVVEQIVLKVGKTFDNGKDVAETIRQLEDVDLMKEIPLVKVLTKTEEPDDAVRNQKNEAFAALHEEDMKRFSTRRDDLRKNKPKAYALIFADFCSSSMQIRIKEHPKYESDLYNDPVELLKAIRVLMHNPVRAMYPYLSLSDAMAKLLNMRQKDDESLNDYVERFKQARSVVKSHIGTSFLEIFVENTTEYQSIDPNDTAVTVKKKNLKDEAFDAFTTGIFLKNSDRKRFGQLVDGFATQYALGNDQYPKTLIAAVDVMSKVKISRERDRNRTENRNRNDGNGGNRGERQASFAQRGQQGRERRCYCCGSPDHVVPQCPKRQTRAREEWFDRQNRTGRQQQQQHHQSNDAQDQDDVSIRSEDDRSVSSTVQTRASWANRQFYQKAMGLHSEDSVVEDKMLQVWTLDSATTCSIAANEKLVDNVRFTKDKIELNTNAGSKIIDEICDVENIGTIRFNKEGIANILGLCDLKKKYRVTLDTAKEDAFCVHTEDGVIRFSADKSGLYTYDPRQATKKKQSSHVATVKENREGFTDRQYKRAVEARKFYHVMGAPTVENLKMLIRQNIVKNCPITIDDVKLAEKIFGPDISTIKGKSTRPRPQAVIDDYIEELVMCMDIMFINQCAFLTTIDKSIRFLMTIPIENRSKDELFRGLDVALRYYNKADFRIKRIECDGEFRVMMDEVQDDLDVEMNYANPGDHVPEAERNNRTVKERVRVGYYRIPYKKIPRVMIRYLAMVSMRSINMFPAKGGISAHYSPHMILSHRNVDYKKHCQIEFGSYVQASQENDPTNTNRARAIDGIYLCPTNNIQGGHEIMDLSTGRVIVRPKVIEVPVTQTVINRVEKMAEDQGFKSLKFMDRNRQTTMEIFPDADQIAGVDDDEYEDSDSDSEEGDEPELEKVNQEELDELFDDMTADEREIAINARENEMADRDQPQEETESDESEPEEMPEDDESNDDNENSDNIVNENDSDDDSDGSSDDDDTGQVEVESGGLRRSTRARSEVVRLDPKPQERSYLQAATLKNKVKKAEEPVHKNIKFGDLEKVKDMRIEKCHNLMSQSVDKENEIVYTTSKASVIAHVMTEIRGKVMQQGHCFGQQYIMQKGLKVFGEKGKKAATKEMDQLYKRNCFEPVSVKEMKPSEKRKAMEALMFLTEKRDGTIKGRMVYNGKPTRDWLSREDAASPTASLESVFLTATIDAHEGRNVMTADVPNAFIQTQMPEQKEGEDRVIMKITGVLVDLLVDLDPHTYKNFVVFENGKKVVYVAVLKAIYGMLQAALLWYQKFRKDLEGIEFVFNDYDPCVANRMRVGKQHTVRFHVDDIMASHMNPKVNDKFENWLNRKYGSVGEVKTTRGKIHEYLGMTFDFTCKGKLKVRMDEYVKNMIEDFSVKLKSTDVSLSPATNNLFEKEDKNKLDKKRAEEFHGVVAKGLFLAKRARGDIHQVISVLCSRVRDPDDKEWMKLVRLIRYLNGTRRKHLTLSIENLRIVKWYVDASFAVHPDFRSHTGAVMTWGDGAVQTISRRQKLNTRSSTEAELVGVDDVATHILWTKLFLEKQGYVIEKNILYQDNQSAILLETNGRKSAGQRSRALNVRYFFIADQVEKGNVVVKHCPTDEMVGDYMTKPLQGSKFREFRRKILGESK